MLISWMLFFVGCAYFSPEEKVDVVVEKVMRQESFASAVDTLIKDVHELWEKKTQEDMRLAQKKVHQFYEKEAQYAFSLLHQQYPQEVLAAEHQLGWVILRLDRHTSRSFRREAGYLEKLSKHLRRCAELLPKEALEPPVESTTINSNGGAPIDSSSMSAL